MIDIQTETDPLPALAPAQYTATVTGAIIDKKGIGSLVFDVYAGAVAAADATNLFTFKLVHGNAPNLSDAADVALADMVIDGVPGDSTTPPTLPKLNATTLAGKRIARLGYRGFGKRYIALVATETGTVDAFLFGCALRGDMAKQPAQ